MAVSSVTSAPLQPPTPTVPDLGPPPVVPAGAPDGPHPFAARAARVVRGLRRTLAAVLVLTALLWAAATALLLGGHAAVLDARDRTLPSYLSALQARAALADADQAAWLSFRTGEVALIGPGQRYRDDITTAGEHLERLARLDSSGSAGQGRLRTVSGQLVTYQGLVEQADASYRAGDRTLSTAYLGYASTLLHAADGPLDQLRDIGALDRAAFGHRSHSAWTAQGWLPALGALAGALLVLLVWAQVRTARIFKRTLSPPLLAATLMLAGLTGWTLTVLQHTDQRLDAAGRHALPVLERVWNGQIATAGAGAAALRADPRALPHGGFDVAASAAPQTALDRLTTAAADTGGLVPGLPAAAALLAVLGGSGIGLRLLEFRG